MARAPLLLRSSLMTELFLYCNGGHYYRSTSTRCPDSGYAHELASEIIDLAGRVRELSYQALLDAGASEAHLMNALLVPPDVGPHPWRCSDVASTQLVELVLARNRWLLESFPTGLLAAALTPQHHLDRSYCRTGSEKQWTLVDRASLRLASASTRCAIESLLASEIRSVVEVRLVSVDATRPPLVISDELINEKAHGHTLIPQGHLWLGFE